MRFRERLIRFMQGRYGIDTTFFVCLVFSCLLAFVNVFVRQWWLQLLVYGVEAVALLRCFSRNYAARSRENQVISGWVWWLKRRADEWRQRCKTSRERHNDPFSVYRKCPSCKAVLRLPKVAGKHTAKCPQCGRSFTVRVPKNRSSKVK